MATKNLIWRNSVDPEATNSVQALALRNCLYKGAEDWAGGQEESRKGHKQRGDRQMSVC